jgi:hypothetical protein
VVDRYSDRGGSYRGGLDELDKIEITSDAVVGIHGIS